MLVEIYTQQLENFNSYVRNISFRLGVHLFGIINYVVAVIVY